MTAWDRLTDAETAAQVRHDLKVAEAIHKGQWLPTGHDGVYERFHSGDGSTFHVEKVQDVEPILNRNKELQKEDGFNSDRSGRRIASIPMAVHLRWLSEGFDCTDPANEVEFRRRLNSSEWRYLRTSGGRV